MEKDYFIKNLDLLGKKLKENIELYIYIYIYIYI